MAYNRVLSSNWGPPFTGHAAQLGYTVTASDGTVLIARTTSGISEPTAGTGYYKVTASFDDTWAGDIEVLWDMPGVTAKVATERLTLGSSAPTATEVADAVRTNLTTELARIDVATSTRLASASYSAAPAAATVADAVRTELAPELEIITELPAQVEAIPAQVVEQSAGTGAWPVTFTVRDGESNPVQGALVRVVLASTSWNQYTNANGQATFNLDNGTTYTKHASREGFTSPDPEAFTVSGPTSQAITLTAANPASEDSPDVVEVYLDLGSLGEAIAGGVHVRYSDTAPAEILALGTQIQAHDWRLFSAVAPSKRITIKAPLSSVLEGAGMGGTYDIKSVNSSHIPEGSTFRVTAAGEFIVPVPPE